MKESSIENFCNRAADLVAYLYGEASVSQSRDFERHVEKCASCNSELLSFGCVRESIGAWRQESLGILDSSRSVAPLARDIRTFNEPKRSPLAALREFFTLTPLWMRGAAAMAVLLVCGLASFGVLHLLKGPEVLLVESSLKINAQEDNNLRIAMENRQAPQVASSSAPNATPVPEEKATVAYRRQSPKKMPLQGYVARANRIRQLRHELATPMDSTLAEFMPFTHTEEERSPRLADLMDYVSN